MTSCSTPLHVTSGSIKNTNKGLNIYLRICEHMQHAKIYKEKYSTSAILHIYRYLALHNLCILYFIKQTTTKYSKNRWSCHSMDRYICKVKCYFQNFTCEKSGGEFGYTIYKKTLHSNPKSRRNDEGFLARVSCLYLGYIKLADNTNVFNSVIRVLF